MGGRLGGGGLGEGCKHAHFDTIAHLFTALFFQNAFLNSTVEAMISFIYHQHA